MSAITTHILDTSRGQPAVDVQVVLALRVDAGWRQLASGVTDRDGRIGDLLDPGPVATGTYRLHFDIGSYFRRLDQVAFYPWAEIVFEIADADQHYHVPLLLNPFGYSTYRGS